MARQLGQTTYLLRYEKLLEIEGYIQNFRRVEKKHFNHDLYELGRYTNYKNKEYTQNVGRVEKKLLDI